MIEEDTFINLCPLHGHVHIRTKMYTHAHAHTHSRWLMLEGMIPLVVLWPPYTYTLKYTCTPAHQKRKRRFLGEMGQEAEDVLGSTCSETCFEVSQSFHLQRLGIHGKDKIYPV